MSHTQHVLIIIPVYNHGSTLPEVVKGALATGYPVLVVDDGSDDDSLAAVEGLPCSSMRLSKNMGKGAAIVRGAQKALEDGYSTIVTIDADGQHDPADIIKLVEEAQKIDEPSMVIGNRQMTQETVPRSSHFGKHFSNFWVRLECGCDLEDTQSGFRLYPVQELLALNPGRTRYDFEIESLVKLAWAGIPISSVAVGVHYPAPGERISHFHKFKDNLRLTILHSMLITRRLMPWPHAQCKDRVPVKKRIEQNLHKNPLKTLQRICKEHASPFWLGFAVWLGIFMGALPLLACHTIAIIYVAHRLHVNIVAAVAASQFCMPPVVPVLCIQVGYFLRKGELLLDLSWQLWLLEIHERLYEWLLGSLLLGPLFGFAGAALMYRAAKRIQNQSILKNRSQERQQP